MQSTKFNIRAQGSRKTAEDFCQPRLALAETGRALVGQAGSPRCGNQRRDPFRYLRSCLVFPPLPRTLLSSARTAGTLSQNWC